MASPWTGLRSDSLRLRSASAASLPPQVLWSSDYQSPERPRHSACKTGAASAPVSSGSCPAGAARTHIFHHCDSGPTYSKEQISSSHTHTCESKLPAPHGELSFARLEHLASGLMAWAAILVRLGSKYNKTRLLAPVCSQATSFQRHYSDFGSGQQSTCSPTRSSHNICKRCCENSTFSEQRFSLFQPLLPRPKGRWRAQTYSQSQTSESLAHLLAIQDVNLPPSAFLPIALLPQVIKRVREMKCSVLLVAPLWRNQAWFPELVQLSVTAPCMI